MNIINSALPFPLLPYSKDLFMQGGYGSGWGLPGMPDQDGQPENPLTNMSLQSLQNLADQNLFATSLNRQQQQTQKDSQPKIGPSFGIPKSPEQASNLFEQQSAAMAFAALQSQAMMQSIGQALSLPPAQNLPPAPLGLGSPTRKRKLGLSTFDQSKAPITTSKAGTEFSSRIRQLVTYLEKVERPRTWSHEETCCLVLVVVQNERLVKQARYKELHLQFLKVMRESFTTETKKTRQAFWARHCRIREKLGAEMYEQLFWHNVPIPSVEGSPKKVKM